MESDRGDVGNMNLGQPKMKGVIKQHAYMRHTIRTGTIRSTAVPGVVHHTMDSGVCKIERHIWGPFTPIFAGRRARLATTFVLRIDVDSELHHTPFYRAEVYGQTQNLRSGPTATTSTYQNRRLESADDDVVNKNIGSHSLFRLEMIVRVHVIYLE